MGETRGRYYRDQVERYNEEKSKEEFKPFAEALNTLMEERGLTGDVLSKEIDISKSAISQYLSAKSFPKLDVLEKIREYFGVSYDYLLGVSGVRTPNPDLQSAIELLGLSEYSLRYIETMQQFEKELLDSLLCSEQGNSLLAYCLAAKKKFSFIRSEIESFNHEYATSADWYAAMHKASELEDTADLWKLRLSRSFETVVNAVLGADALSSELQQLTSQLRATNPKSGS